MSRSPIETSSRSVTERRPLVASPNETMLALKIGREKLYQLLNSGELESYREGGSRRVLWLSIDAYVARRLEQEAKRRGRVA